MKRIVNALSKLNWGKRACAVLGLCATTAISLPAQIATLTTLYRFVCYQNVCPDGAGSKAGLVQTTNGGLYGTTYGGGANGYGTVFRITPGGTLTTLYSFCSHSGCTDGADSFARLVQATNGDLYGTTYNGQGIDYGTVFKITPSGTLTTLHSFCSQTNCADGSGPVAELVQAANGSLYGTTAYGGAGGSAGTIFKITPSGTLTTLYSFCSQPYCRDGENPVVGLVQAANGDFYGTTPNGGANGHGTVFKITPAGTLTTLHSFKASTDGAVPSGGLVQAANGDFYGTAVGVGANNFGTVFKITPGGTLTTLYRFCSQANCTDGSGPSGGLVQATDGDLYGTTEYGGANGVGTVFRISPGGALTTLYSFCFLTQSGCTDGNEPYTGLVQDTNGDFYGTTGDTIFRLSVGLGPFVKGRPVSGEVGTAVEILGTDLNGATSVSFNGTAATFTVASRYLITTTVPAGASTGPIQVVTPNRTLSSNGSFRVLP